MRELETGAAARGPASVIGWVAESHPGGVAR